MWMITNLVKSKDEDRSLIIAGLFAIFGEMLIFVFVLLFSTMLYQTLTYEILLLFFVTMIYLALNSLNILKDSQLLHINLYNVCVQIIIGLVLGYFLS